VFIINIITLYFYVLSKSLANIQHLILQSAVPKLCVGLIARNAEITLALSKAQSRYFRWPSTGLGINGAWKKVMISNISKLRINYSKPISIENTYEIPSPVKDHCSTAQQPWQRIAWWTHRYAELLIFQQEASPGKQNMSDWHLT